jgi:ABC-type transport system involved in multi-copper enzyme maturation permease subunit
MIRSLHAELLKLRRPAVLYGAAGSMLGFALLATILTYVTASSTAAGSAATGGASLASTVAQLGQAGGLTRGFAIAAGFIGLLVFVLFTTSMTSEYSLGTIRVLLLRQPRRVRLLTGKLLALLACVAAALLAAELISGGAAVALAHARGIPTADWFTMTGLGHVAGDYANAMLSVTAFGTVGITLGMLVRSTPIALGIGLAWLGPLEHITQLGWSGAAHWFPGLLFDAIATGGAANIPYQRALIAALVYAALALTAGIVSFTRRDVSV